jgi:hypothetical protein
MIDPSSTLRAVMLNTPEGVFNNHRVDVSLYFFACVCVSRGPESPRENRVYNSRNVLETLNGS